MATFQVQVEGLTSLSIGTTPTAAELSEFLKDGVIDVTNRWLAMKPQDIEDFVRGSSTQSSNGFATSGANIVSVIREAGADGDTDGSTAWEPCRKVPSSMRSRVVDVDSLSYASKYNPVYIINNNSAVNVYPVPDGTDDGYRVYYVNNEPKGDGIVDELAAGHSTIGYFPKDKVYLVVLYASMRSLQANMGATTISDLSVTAVPPDVPLLSTITFSSVDSAVDSSLTAVVTSTYIPPAPPDRPNFESSITDEDLELVQMKSQQYQSDISAFQSEMQSEVHKFQASVQESMAEFQSQNQMNISNAERSQNRQLQNSINDMKVIYDSNTQLIQKWTQELAQYQAEIANEVQEYTQNLQADSAGYQWLQGQYAALKAEYDAAFMIAAPKPQPQQQARR